MSAQVVGSILALLTFNSAGACAKDGVTTPNVPAPSVVFLTPAGEVPVSVEVANNNAERATGLMFRRELATNAGMIFVFPSETEHAFWMKNTLISLDMIFLNKDAEVVGIVADAEPQTETARTVHASSLYVVEVAGGFAAAHGIVAKTGARLSHIPKSEDQD